MDIRVRPPAAGSIAALAATGLLLAAGPALAQEGEQASEQASCSVPEELMELATPRARCWIEALSTRCTETDACMVRCIANRTGGGIGGGCWHVCFAYTGLTFTPLPELGACPAERYLPDPRGPTPTPWITCSTNGDGGTLQGRVLSDSTGLPLPGVDVYVRPTGDGRQEAQLGRTDDRGTFSIRIPGTGRHRVRFMTPRLAGQQAFMDLEPGMSCEITVRLRSYWDPEPF